MGHTKIGGCESRKRVGWKWEGLRKSHHASEKGEECEEHGDRCRIVLRVRRVVQYAEYIKL